MKKTIATKLKLAREHIRLLTPTDLKAVLGGSPDDGGTNKPTISANCPTQSQRIANTCGVIGP